MKQQPRPPHLPPEAPINRRSQNLLLAVKIESRGLCLTILDKGPFFHMMTSAIKNEGNLSHVSRIRLNVCSVFEFENESIRIAAACQHHTRLVLCGTIMRGH